MGEGGGRGRVPALVDRLPAPFLGRLCVSSAPGALASGRVRAPPGVSGAGRGMGPRHCPRRPRFCCRVVDVLLKAIMRTMWLAGGFHRVVVKGRQALPTEAAILTLAPHSSYFDAIPVTMTMSSVVMKAESRDIPIWGSE